MKASSAEAVVQDIGLDHVRELLRRAILTLLVVPDPDLRYRIGPKNSWPSIIQETRDAYGSAPPKLRVFNPTNRDLSLYIDLLGMLAWYAREWSEETVRIFRAWTLGASMWQMQERCSTNRRNPASPKTVRNRIDGMVKTIAEEFRESLFLYTLDNFPKVANKAPSPKQDAEFAGADVRKLPRTVKLAWSAPAEPPLNGKAKRAAHKALTKELERNQSRAKRRKEQQKRKAQ